MPELNFEEALQELEVLVRRLEDGKVGLEEAVSVYERGMTLKKFCEEKLCTAKMRVDQITFESDGTSTIKPFEDHTD